MNDNSNTRIQMIADFEGDASVLIQQREAGIYPTLCTRDLVVFPAVLTPIVVGRKKSQELVNMLEQKLEKIRFTRVDADIIDRLIVKEDAKKTDLTKDQSDNLTEVFRSQMPKLDKAEFFVEIQALGEQNQPVLITQNEYMRRMKAMSQFQAGMNFYGQMPDSYNIVLNSDHALVKKVLEDAEANTADALKPILAEIKGQEARLAVLHQEQGKKKPEEITQEEKDDVHNTEKAISDEKAKRNDIISGYAKNNNIVHQLIDLALLQNGMLKGASLDAFLKRSVDMIK